VFRSIHCFHVTSSLTDRADHRTVHRNDSASISSLLPERRMTMEGTKTAVELFAPWTKAQETFWERWRAAMANDAMPEVPTIGMGKVPIEFWKAALYGSLEVQLATAEAWRAWVCANDANAPEMRMGACQTLHFVEDWTRAQMQLWEGWFAALESLMPQDTGREAEAPQATAQPRAQQHARQHTTATHAQPHNGVPA
jgi:hypothetical protein